MILIDKIKTAGSKTGFLTRSQIERLTGGLIKKTYLANADWAGTGINGRILFGKRVVYPVNDVIGWIEKKIGK